MRVWIVGSGTLVPQPHRGSPAHWMEAGGLRVLMDCGAGTLRNLAGLGLEWQRLSHLLVSHFHTDHVGELAALFFALKNGVVGGRRAPLTVLGPTGIKAHLAALAQAHGDHIRDPGFPLIVREIKPGEGWHSGRSGFHLRTLPTHHSLNSMAMRLDVEGIGVGYTGDAGPRPELGPFFRGCDLLIAECSHPDGAGTENHLTPGDLAAMASEASPHLLIPVHCYSPLRPEDVPRLLERAGYPGKVVSGWDGLCIDLERGGAKVLEVQGF